MSRWNVRMFKVLVVVTRGLRRLSNVTGRWANWFTRNEVGPRIRDLLPVFRARREPVKFVRYGKRWDPRPSRISLPGSGLDGLLTDINRDS